MPGQISILIVDDDANFANTLSRILGRKGYSTATAANGLHAIDLIKEKLYDVVLMDIKMPVMSGVETYKNMKVIRPNITVILMTAFSVEDLVRDAIKAGVYAIIRKPFEIDTIINMIEKSNEGVLLAVVDDDPNICKTMKAILERRGFSVSTCASGEEAISLAKDRPHDIFFIDLKLPVLNGLETYLEIKKINPKAITVIMTGFRHEMEELIKQATEKGVYACMHKPFNMDEAIKVVEEIVSRRKQLKNEHINR